MLSQSLSSLKDLCVSIVWSQWFFLHLFPISHRSLFPFWWTTCITSLKNELFRFFLHGWTHGSEKNNGIRNRNITGISQRPLFLLLSTSTLRLEKFHHKTEGDVTSPIRTPWLPSSVSQNMCHNCPLLLYHPYHFTHGQFLSSWDPTSSSSSVYVKRNIFSARSNSRCELLVPYNDRVHGGLPLLHHRHHLHLRHGPHQEEGLQVWISICS